LGPISHIELSFHRFFATGEYLICDIENVQSLIEIEGSASKDHQTKIAIKGTGTKDHQTKIEIKGTETKDHQILLDIWAEEHHIH